MRNILDTARKIKSEVQEGVGRGARDTHHSTPGATTGLESITTPERSLQSILEMFQQRGPAISEVRRLHSLQEEPTIFTHPLMHIRTTERAFFIK